VAVDGTVVAEMVVAVYTLESQIVVRKGKPRNSGSRVGSRSSFLFSSGNHPSRRT